jgi:hypothetical protein
VALEYHLHPLEFHLLQVERFLSHLLDYLLLHHLLLEVLLVDYHLHLYQVQLHLCMVVLNQVNLKDLILLRIKTLNQILCLQ